MLLPATILPIRVIGTPVVAPSAVMASRCEGAAAKQSS